MTLRQHSFVGVLFIAGLVLAYTNHRDAAVLVFAGACLVVLIVERKMKLYLVDVEWNHKGARYEKKSTERVNASSVATAARAAIAETKRKNRGSIRETTGARFYLTVTVIGEEETPG